MAESAVRAGFAVTAVDAYADLDLAAIADAHLVSPYTPQSVAATVQRLLPARSTPHVPKLEPRTPNPESGAALCYVSNLENHPEALRRLSQGRVLWGNSPRTLAAVRSPERLAHVLSNAGLSVPALRARAPGARSKDSALRWLLKPRASGGGHGIATWKPGTPVPRHAVLQERIRGPAGSFTFAADGKRCVPIAITRQLIGDRRFGAKRFRYCGNLLAPASDPGWGRQSPLWNMVAAAATVVTCAFGLVGVNGIDFILRRGRPVLIEVNPRFTAAMELAERRDGLSVFAAHAAGCQRRLHRLVAPDARAGALGKALVFARTALTAGKMDGWLVDPDIRDVPRPGTAIPNGAPICTVIAAGNTVAECERRLVAKANEIYRAVAAWG